MVLIKHTKKQKSIKKKKKAGNNRTIKKKGGMRRRKDSPARRKGRDRINRRRFPTRARSSSLNRDIFNSSSSGVVGSPGGGGGPPGGGGMSHIENIAVEDEYYECLVESGADGKLLVKCIDKSLLQDKTAAPLHPTIPRGIYFKCLENLADIIHDVVASGNLSYDALLSVRLCVKCFSSIYSFNEKISWKLLAKGLINEEDDVLTNQNAEKKFIDWYNKTQKGNDSITIGKNIEEALKEHLYKEICNVNCFIMNPRYTGNGIEFDLLNDWEYLSEEFITPYAGGGDHGPLMWKTILGMGNNWLDKDMFPFMDGFIPQPTPDEEFEWQSKYKQSAFDQITIEDLFDLKKIKEGKVELDYDKTSFLTKYILYYMYKFWGESETTNSGLLALYDDLFIKKGGERIHDSNSLLDYVPVINFTDAESKASSAMNYQWEKMRGDYGPDDRHSIENIHVSNLCDESDGRVGSIKSLSSLGMNKTPVLRESIAMGLGSQKLSYEKALLTPFQVRYELVDSNGDRNGELVVDQEAKRGRDSDEEKFLKELDDVYTRILNDIRLSYMTYGLKPSTGTNDMIKLKMFHLLLMIISIFKNNDESECMDLEMQEKVNRLDNFLIRNGFFFNSKSGEYLKSGMIESFLSNFFAKKRDKAKYLEAYWEDFSQDAPDYPTPEKDKKTWSEIDKDKAWAKAIIDISNSPQGNQKEAISRYFFSNIDSEDEKKYRACKMILLRRTPFYSSKWASERIEDVLVKKASIGDFTFLKKLEHSRESISKLPNGGKKFTQTEIKKEYLDIAYSFSDDAINEATDLFIGWFKMTFQNCSCGNVKEFEDSDFEDPLLLKGVCVKTKNGSNNIGKLRVLPGRTYDETYTLKFLNMNTKEEKFVAGVVRVPKDNLKIYIKENYFKCIGDGEQVRTEEDYWIFNQESASAGAGGGESKRKRADFLNLIEDSGIKLTSFSSGVNRGEIWNKTIRKAAEYCKDEKIEETRIFLKAQFERPIIKLLYNFVLFDFEKYGGLMGFKGSRTTGRCLDKNLRILKKQMLNKTFIQGTLESAIDSAIVSNKTTQGHQLLSLVRSGKQISIHQDKPSVSNITREARHCMTYCLIKENKLTIGLVKELLENADKFFTIVIESDDDKKKSKRTAKEDKKIQILLNKLYELFLDPEYILKSISEKEKIIKGEEIKLMRDRNELERMTEEPKRKKEKSQWNKRKKSLQKKLRNAEKKILKLKEELKGLNGNNRKATSKDKKDLTENILPKIVEFVDSALVPDSGFNMFDCLGLVLNHKTQTDEMQLHWQKAVKNLFFRDNFTQIRQPIYHCYTYDALCGIKALIKGASVIFQKGRGVVIGLSGKVDGCKFIQDAIQERRKAWDSAGLNLEDFYNQKSITVQLNTDIPELHLTEQHRMKFWFENNIAVRFKRIGNMRTYDTELEAEINEKFSVDEKTYNSARKCLEDILNKIKNRYRRNKEELKATMAYQNTLFHPKGEEYIVDEDEEEIYDLSSGSQKKLCKMYEIINLVDIANIYKNLNYLRFILQDFVDSFLAIHVSNFYYKKNIREKLFCQKIIGIIDSIPGSVDDDDDDDDDGGGGIVQKFKMRNLELVEKGSEQYVKILGWVRMGENQWNNYDDLIFECIKEGLEPNNPENNAVLTPKIKSMGVEPDEVVELDYYSLTDEERDSYPDISDYIDDSIEKLEDVICNIKLIKVYLKYLQISIDDEHVRDAEKFSKAFKKGNLETPPGSVGLANLSQQAAGFDSPRSDDSAQNFGSPSRAVGSSPMGGKRNSLMPAVKSPLTLTFREYINYRLSRIRNAADICKYKAYSLERCSILKEKAKKFKQMKKKLRDEIDILKNEKKSYAITEYISSLDRKMREIEIDDDEYDDGDGGGGGERKNGRPAPNPWADTDVDVDDDDDDDDAGPDDLTDLPTEPDLTAMGVSVPQQAMSVVPQQAMIDDPYAGLVSDPESVDLLADLYNQPNVSGPAASAAAAPAAATPAAAAPAQNATLSGNKHGRDE